MRENEEAIWPLAGAQIDEFIGRGEFEVIGDYAHISSAAVYSSGVCAPDAGVRMSKRIVNIGGP